jgi:hypothetical protein
MVPDTLTLPQGHLSPEAQVLGEALVAAINVHWPRSTCICSGTRR